MKCKKCGKEGKGLPCQHCFYPLDNPNLQEIRTEQFKGKKIKTKKDAAWSCPRCTFLNHPDMIKCEICESQRREDAPESPLREEYHHIDDLVVLPFDTFTDDVGEEGDTQTTEQTDFIYSSSSLSEIEVSPVEIRIDRVKDRRGAIYIPSHTSHPLHVTNQQHVVIFRYWAPSATSVSVIGDWNNWDESADVLKRESNGEYWRSHLHTPKPGDKYLFAVTFGKSKNYRYRNDPRGDQLVTCHNHQQIQKKLQQQQQHHHQRGGFVNVITDHSDYHWTDQLFSPPPMHQLIIYQLHVATFPLSYCTSSSPHIQKHGLPRIGRFEEVRERLGYLKEIGINCIALLPITQDSHTSPHNCWGYDPISFFAIHSDYGSPTDLKRLVDHAHSHGIAVIFDLVVNHLSGRHILEAEHYFPHDDQLRTTDWGPRPNYSSSEVVRYILDSIQEMFDQYHMDGVRVDSTCNIRGYRPHHQSSLRMSTNVKILASGWELLQLITSFIRTKYPGKISIAEDLNDPNGDVINASLSFDAQWDSVFHTSLLQTLIVARDTDRDMNKIVSALSHSLQTSSPIAGRVIYTENHDTVPSDRQGRIPASVLRGTQRDWPLCSHTENNYYALKRASLGIVVMMTTPGIPMILQGQEIFETCAGAWPIGPIVDWSRAERLHGTSLRMVHDLCSLRCNSLKHSRGLGGGNIRIFHVNHSAKTIAYHRYVHGGAADDVIVLCNFSYTHFDSYIIGVPRSGHWFVRYNSDSTSYSPLFHNFGSPNVSSCSSISNPRDGFANSIEVSISGYSAIILSQDPPPMSFQFRTICDNTKFGEHLLIVGNLPSLGEWRVEKGIRLKTGYSDCAFPIWISPLIGLKDKEQVMMITSSYIEFKFIKLIPISGMMMNPHNNNNNNKNHGGGGKCIKQYNDTVIFDNIEYRIEWEILEGNRSFWIDDHLTTFTSIYYSKFSPLEIACKSPHFPSSPSTPKSK